MGRGSGLSAGAWGDAAGRLGRPATELAPALLGATLVSGPPDVPERCAAVRIVEVEAYSGADDPASHAYRGPGRRNATMFGPPGRAYVYFSYGMHWCLNVVCSPVGTATAVLLRAGAVADGEQLVASRRPGIRRLDWARGPGRLTRALGIDGSFDGLDLTDPASRLRLLPGVTVAPERIRSGPRVGVSTAVERPWRFWIEGEPAVSAYRPGRPRAGQSPA